MIRPSKATQAYLYTGTVDMRKSIDSLAALVENDLELGPCKIPYLYFVIAAAIKYKFCTGSATALYSGINVLKNRSSNGLRTYPCLSSDFSE